jgi:hypothetical protein
LLPRRLWEEVASPKCSAMFIATSIGNSLVNGTEASQFEVASAHGSGLAASCCQ